jgi:ribosomal RNA methyltransferase Nop2
MFIKENTSFQNSNLKTHRINHLLKIIKNFESFLTKKSKKYYFQLLVKEISQIFGYPKDSINYFLNLFPISETLKFIEFNEKPRPLTIRFNALKENIQEIKYNLEKKGIKIFCLDKPFNVAGIIVKSKMKIGNISEFLGGYYTLQSVASLLPVLSLDPKKSERILDIAAAPGGKSTFISQLMENKGVLVANDKNKIRIKSLVSSIHRMGITNCIVTNLDGTVLPFLLKGFDKVLIDAPCTGTGIISHDLHIKLKNISKKTSVNFTSQKRLLLAAIDACNERSINGGIIVYSTCSILVEENECVIQYAIQNRNVKIIETGLNFGMPGYKKFKGTVFNDNMEKCRRFFPHVHNTDGFFICKLKKFPS